MNSYVCCAEAECEICAHRTRISLHYDRNGTRRFGTSEERAVCLQVGDASPFTRVGGARSSGCEFLPLRSVWQWQWWH